MHCSYRVIIFGKHEVFEPEYTTILELKRRPVNPESSSSYAMGTRGKRKNNPDKQIKTTMFSIKILYAVID